MIKKNRRTKKNLLPWAPSTTYSKTLSLDVILYVWYKTDSLLTNIWHWYSILKKVSWTSVHRYVDDRWIGHRLCTEYNSIMLSVNFFCNMRSYDILAYITNNYIALIYYAKIVHLLCQFHAWKVGFSAVCQAMYS